MRAQTSGQHHWWGVPLAIVLGLSMVSTVQAQQQALKVGVVDLQAVLDNSTRGKAAKDRLKELSVKLQEEIKTKREVKDKREDELQRMRTEIRSQGLVLSEQARSAKEEDFRNKARELKRFIDDTNRFIEDATQEFREREIRETQRLLGEIRKVVQEIGKQENYTLVLEGNEGAALVLYFGKPLDLTQKVTQRYDQSSAGR
jgi:outer membrane protein